MRSEVTGLLWWSRRSRRCTSVATKSVASAIQSGEGITKARLDEKMKS
jgi:hypothetical protein